MSNSEYTHLQINADTAEEVLWNLYGIKGKATRLPGEYDMNFKINSEGQDKYILKISRPGTDPKVLSFQQELLDHLDKSPESILAPSVIKDKNQETLSLFKDGSDQQRLVRLLSWIPGRVYQQVHPKREALRRSLGDTCGTLCRALQNFDHQKAHRIFEWDIANSLWTQNHLNIFSEEDQELIGYFQRRFSRIKQDYDQLRKSVIHNDANDHNLIVNDNLEAPEVIALIDYGDAIYSQTINDLAVTCAYGIMEQNDPLTAAASIVGSYHESMNLEESELSFLYDCIAMRLVITLTKSAQNRLQEPDNIYLQVSAKPARELLVKWKEISEDYAHFTFRRACGLTAHPNEEKIKSILKNQNSGLNLLFPTRNSKDCVAVDLSVSSRWLGHLHEFANFDIFDFKIEQFQKQHPDKIIAGGYLEPRMVYTTDAYKKNGNERKESRTMHLGIDFWLPAGTAVHAPLKGEIVVARNDAGDKEYGGLIILKHEIDGIIFYSLYGHLSVKSATNRKVGETIGLGEYLAELGPYPENGNWPPHLHFEIMLSLLNFTNDFPGVAYKSELDIWKSICPDPNLLFGLESLKAKIPAENKTLMDFRRDHLGKGMSLSYDEPLQIVRGMGAYLIDQYGNTYLDTVNNVAHVGHEHPQVVKAGQEQMALLNTNTRYLHQNIVELAQELLSTFPPELSVVHFVNSGSEANELALRMARTVTGNQDILASEMGYHGNTNNCIDISSYKFEGKGGAGCPEYTQIFPIPDVFRGKYRGEESGSDYAKEVELKILDLQKKGRNPAAFIIEPIISCGGQIELPKGFLSKAYEHTRRSGGLCISDEVQVGCGRLGKTFWGFQLHDVTPDIVTIGKPLGNGHPVAAVVCSKRVADSFANGMEYFNTFGGNPVSCAIAKEVLQTVKTHQLQANALEVGEYLKEKLKELSAEFKILRDIRGQGLFLGVELTDDNLNPLPEKTHYVANRMKDKGILMSIDGPDHNVLKIKPPLVFSKDNAQELIYALKAVLREDFIKI